MAFPVHVEEIGPEWLTAVLRAEGVLARAAVTSVSREHVGEEAGFLSTVGRCQLTYDRAEPGAPTSVVVKLQPDVAEYAEAESELHAFTREVRFYREVAPTVPLRVPRVYATPEAGERIALVMEDLSFARLGDQVAGIHTDQVIAGARAIARLQGQYWDNEALNQLSWMPFKDHFDLDFADKWPHFLDVYRKELSNEGRRVGDALCSQMPEVASRIESRPKTLVHQDLRADNMAFVDGPDGEEPIIFDWAVAVRSVGAYDVARLLGGSEPTRERQGHQLEVIRAWHDELVASGVHDYTRADALLDFRLGALAVLAIPVHFCADPPEPGTRSDALFHAIASRLFASVVEIDAMAALD
ncbi:MAG: phosphotransferase [Myxococcota bacterium]